MSSQYRGSMLDGTVYRGRLVVCGNGATHLPRWHTMR